MLLEILVVTIFSYTCGSIPFGLILTKIFLGKDVRKIGSGNIGATNVLRTGNKYIAIITLLLDISKGFIPVIISQEFFPDYVHLSGLLTFLGHLFPIWLNFKGGKGVATYLGVLIGLSIELSILFVFTWIVTTLIFKYSSVSSIFSTLTVFIISFLTELSRKIIKFSNSNLNDDSNAIILFIFLILIIFTHKKNISNLKNKKENKIKL
jgi:glycerol-3-phosphate acyltransferase PlsY